MKHICMIFVIIFFASLSITSCPIASNCTPGTATAPLPSFGFGIFKVKLGSISKTSAGASEGYKNFSCVDTAQLLEGTNYAIEITNGTFYDENVRVWIDFDNNGIFDPITELVFTSDNKKIHSGNIFISSGMMINTRLRMRVSSDWNGSPQTITPCSTPSRSQVEDYGVVIKSNTNPPTANFIASNTKVCDGEVSFTNLSTGSITSQKWYFGNGDTSNLANPSYIFVQPRKYTIKLVVKNSYGSDSITKINYITQNDSIPNNISCKPITTNFCCGYGFYNLNYQNNNYVNPVNNLGKYLDFTCSERLRLIQGDTQNVVVTTSSTATQDVKIWIDYNNNGVFDDVTELVGTSLNKKTHTFPIDGYNRNINTVLDQALRMRISTDYEGNTLTSCTNPEKGQVLDMTVVISENKKIPVANFTSSNNNSTCDSLITFKDVSKNITSSWKWYFGDGDSSSLATPSHIYRYYGSYNVTFVAGNDFGKDTIIKTITYNGKTTAPICRPENTAYCCGVGLKKLKINNDSIISNATNYKDNSCQSFFKINKGSNLNYKIETGLAFNEDVKIWIDYNNDGFFNNKELVDSSFNKNMHSNTLILPTENIVYNRPIRIRVTTDYRNNPISNACSSVQYGHTEDFALFIVDTTLRSSFKSNDSLTCSGLVNFTNNQNYKSSASWSFGDGSFGIGNNPVHNYTNDGMYTVKLKVCNESKCDSTIKNNYIVKNVGAAICLSEKKEIASSIYKIYPNPSSDIVNIETETDINYIALIDITGKRLLTKISNINTLTDQINIAEVPKGIYIIEVTSKNRAAIRQRIIKN